MSGNLSNILSYILSCGIDTIIVGMATAYSIGRKYLCDKIWTKEIDETHVGHRQKYWNKKSDS